MKLITSELLKTMPALYATEHVPLASNIVRAKLFAPWSRWTWYLIERQPDGPIAWGLIVGHESEFGYIDVSELEAVSGPGGLGIERDMNFVHCTIAEVIARDRIQISSEFSPAS